tara:strand:- start:10203 stop:11606 length:1404 start_codon:yes stop_codon:yes gene_type:complete
MGLSDFVYEFGYNHVYGKSPIFVQNLLCSTYGILEKRKRFSNHFFTYLDWLEESQYWGEQEIYEYKLMEIKKIYNHAYTSVPFYQNKYKNAGLGLNSIQEISDILKIPILEKEEVRQNWNNMISNANPDGKLYLKQTSGSSGKALDFYATKRSISFQWAIWWRFRKRFGINFGDKSLNFIADRVVPIKQKNPPFWRVNKPLNQHLVNMQHIKAENIKYFVDYINKEKFVFFSGYPNILYTFCRLTENSGYIITNPPKFIFTGAEKLLANQKSCIERVLNCLVTEQYGFSEGAGNASKCEHGLYHEDFEYGHLEFHNATEISQTTFNGELIATGFSNYGMPLIRYNVGDNGTWSTKKCICGRQSDVILSIDGRNEDVIITPEGTTLQFHGYIFDKTKEIVECQVVQYKLGEMVFRIVMRDDYTSKVENDLIKNVKKLISPTIKVKFEYLEQIERTESGKIKLLVSYLN